MVVIDQSGALSFVPRPNRALLSNEFTMLEYNFALFFSLSVQLYETTHLDIFTGEAACSACHAGAELTDNSVRILAGSTATARSSPTITTFTTSAAADLEHRQSALRDRGTRRHAGNLYLPNLELTAPYFHNGGQRTIRQTVEFSNRGGDSRDQNADRSRN